MRAKAFLIALGVSLALSFGEAAKPAPAPTHNPARAKPKVIDLDFTDDSDEAPDVRAAQPSLTATGARPWIFWTLGASAVAAGGVTWYLLENRKEPEVTRSEQVFTDERP